MIRTDCFGFKDNDCTALNKLYCAYEDCSFYKTLEQYHADLDEALRRDCIDRKAV